jgi:hypothetical protein
MTFVIIVNEKNDNFLELFPKVLFLPQKRGKYEKIFANFRAAG